MVLYGQRSYGKVDAVPGVGHVVTRFYHVNFLPLIPNESWIVTSRDGQLVWRARIPLSLKSVLVGWTRGVATAVGLAATILSIALATDVEVSVRTDLTLAAVAVTAWAVLVTSRVVPAINRASYARACELAKLAGLHQSRIEALAAAYGQPPPTFGFQPIVGPTKR